MEKQGEKKASEQSTGGRLLLFPMPLQGHINPMLQLANILHSEGFKITIIHTNFNSPNKSNYPHFTFEPISESLVENEFEGSSAADIGNVLILIKLLNNTCVDPFRDCMVRLLSEEPILCLITDAILEFTQAVADKLKVPRIVLRTGSLSSFHVFHSHPLLREKGYFSMKDYKSEAPVAEIPPLKVKDIPMVFTHEEESPHEILEAMMKATKAASGLIWNSFEELEQSSFIDIRQDFPIPNFTIGPFHKYFLASSSSLFTQDRTSISWLDLQKPESVLYVSFGSILTIDKGEFLEMAWGLANSMQKFLWVVRPGVIRGSEWLEPLPDGLVKAVSERGHIVKWAPQQEVLAHPATACFWTHNGWNSTLESICEGVPMICSPCFGDQPVNARYVEGVWKVGVVLENGLERREIQSGIRRLMVDEEGKEMKRRMVCLKEKVNLCLKQGGSSNQSLQNLVRYIMSL
uniref:UGT13 n=1 Tax=Panax ginseng TaxID=4054 RepID=A0A068J502_PANGI|nr:UGT13 [Panax ginseng]